MGSSMHNASKSSGASAGTGMPEWSKVGSGAYQNMNTGLQTAPMAAQNSIYASGGSNANMDTAGNTLSNYASGKYVGNDNPQLNAIINRSNQAATDQVNQGFAAGGRYGSGMNQGAVADAVSNNTNNLLYNNYNQQQQNQLSAANSLGSLGNSQIGNVLGAMGQLGNVQNNKVFDANQQMGVGSQFDKTAQNQLSDLQNQYTQNDQSGWARLGSLLSAGTQSAGNWGTQNGTSKTTQPMNWGGLLGALFSL